MSIARRALVIGAIARAQGLVTGAINTMAALARDTEQPGSARLRASPRGGGGR